MGTLNCVFGVDFLAWLACLALLAFQTRKMCDLSTSKFAGVSAWAFLPQEGQVGKRFRFGGPVEGSLAILKIVPMDLIDSRVDAGLVVDVKDSAMKYTLETLKEKSGITAPQNLFTLGRRIVTTEPGRTRVVYEIAELPHLKVIVYDGPAIEKQEQSRF